MISQAIAAATRPVISNVATLTISLLLELYAPHHTFYIGVGSHINGARSASSERTCWDVYIFRYIQQAHDRTS